MQKEAEELQESWGQGVCVLGGGVGGGREIKEGFLEEAVAESLEKNTQ